jgi:hypothetical protein
VVSVGKRVHISILTVLTIRLASSRCLSPRSLSWFPHHPISIPESRICHDLVTATSIHTGTPYLVFSIPSLTARFSLSSRPPSLVLLPRPGPLSSQARLFRSSRPVLLSPHRPLHALFFHIHFRAPVGTESNIARTSIHFRLADISCA